MIALEGGTPVRKEFLMFHRYWLDEEEEKEVIDTLRSGWLTYGPRTKQFEELFRSYVKASHAVGVNSGTSALHLALATLGIGPKDEVITSTNTFASSVNVVLHSHANPILVDIEHGTMNIDVSKIEEKITPRTKVIIPVHIAGHPCRMDEIKEIAEKHNLIILEDAAHAIESEYKGKKIGSISDFTAFSFYATKNITTGEGGMLTAKNKEYAEKARILSMHGISKDAWMRYSKRGYQHYDIIYPGYNYHMFDIQAALGLKQLPKIGKFRQRREEITRIYNEELAGLPIETPVVENDVKSAHYLYIIKLKLKELKVGRDTILNALQAENIGVGVHFIAVHRSKFYREYLKPKKNEFPVADYVSESALSLPLYPRMSDEDAMDVVEAVRKVLKYYSNQN